MDDERRQILEEAAELDHIWGVWEEETEPTNIPSKWLKQASRSRDDLRYHAGARLTQRTKMYGRLEEEQEEQEEQEEDGAGGGSLSLARSLARVRALAH